MKCGSVQSLIVEYAEGALGPADEMCIDIHLIQCEECRSEIAGLRDLLGSVAGSIHACESCDDAVEFLERFHAVAAAEVPAPTPRDARAARLPVLRLTAAAVGFILALSSGLFGGASRWIPAPGAPIAEARVRDRAPSDWSPYMRSGLDIRDLEDMGLVGYDAPHSAPSGD